jgi:enoyl-[acyl-carrier-protein] reductase (NADH)
MEVIAARAAQTNVSFEKMEQTCLDRISLRRMVTVEDIAASVAYLLSPPGRNVSGQSLARYRCQRGGDLR